MSMMMVLSSVLLLTSCNREEVENNGNHNGNTDNPVDSTYNNQEYPSTAHVIRKAVADIDGNIYDAVQIGNKVWMAENLRTTRYADGTAIPKGNSTSTSTIYRYAPDANEGYVPSYGYLYNWPAVMHGSSSSSANPSGVQGICPQGWHVPSDAEWEQLSNYVSSQSQYVCIHSGVNGNAKALAATWGWKEYHSSSYDYNPCNVGCGIYDNNATGFSTLPAGKYPYNSFSFGEGACFWTATAKDNEKAMTYQLEYDYNCLDDGWRTKDAGCSVRCVRD